MSQDLISSAPGIYKAMLSLIKAAGVGQSPAVPVFPFELGQYEPGSYVTVHAIENHEFVPAHIGTFTQEEHYDIVGIATVFTGSSVTDDATVATDILAQTYSLFQEVVMVPIMSNRLMPILGTTGPSPYQILPGFARYEGMVGEVGGGPGGWTGVLNWSFHFDAQITPA